MKPHFYNTQTAVHKRNSITDDILPHMLHKIPIATNIIRSEGYQLRYN
jgi:hypothetical protein